MTSLTDPPDPARRSTRQLYLTSFFNNCLRLLGKAHIRLDLPPLRDEQEPAITDRLVRDMIALVEDDGAPAWMGNLIPLDDPPQDSPDRFGKAQRRIDIEFVLVRRGPRPRFHFEAKRLYRSDSVREYLGPEGLELFVLGEYARSQDAGGMLGYVQTDRTADWERRIGAGLNASRERLCVCEGTDFEESKSLRELESVHLSYHERNSVGRSILMYHTLLLCH